MKIVWITFNAVVAAAIFYLIGVAIFAGDSVKQQGIELRWKNEARLYGTHPDTIQMFLDAPDCLPINDSLMMFRRNGVARKISHDGQKAVLIVTVSKKQTRDEDNGWQGAEEWQFVFRQIDIFDLTMKPKK